MATNEIMVNGQMLFVGDCAELYEVQEPCTEIPIDDDFELVISLEGDWQSLTKDELREAIKKAVDGYFDNDEAKEND